jgi:PAS domain S-box-containing protein
MADHAPVMIWMSDEKGNCTFLSRSWYEFTGMENGDGLGKGWLMAIHPGDRERRQHLLASHAARDSVELEYRLLNAEGEYRWVLEKVTPRHGDDHAPLGYIGTILDITERKLSEDHIRFLMREVNHRAKNLLAVVRAIARQTAALTEASAFTPRFDERLSGLTASYDLLVHNRWQGVDISDLAKAQLAHFADLIGERISLQGEPFRLSASAAQNLGLALNELSTNAAKYGALSTLSGRLEIGWHVDETADPQHFVLTWHESGGPMVSPPKRRGLGHRLTTGFIEQALEGKVELHYAAEGLHWRLTAPRLRLEKADMPESDHGQE